MILGDYYFHSFYFNGKLKSTKPNNLETLHHANSWQTSLIEQTSNNFIRNAKL